MILIFQKAEIRKYIFALTVLFQLFSLVTVDGRCTLLSYCINNVKTAGVGGVCPPFKLSVNRVPTTVREFGKFQFMIIFLNVRFLARTGTSTSVIVYSCFRP